MLQFKSQLIKTDVTAIARHKNVTLVGIGSTLHVFCNNTDRLINKINIEDTRGELIFGIKLFGKNKLLVFGGPFLLIFSTDQHFTHIKEIHRVAHKDWILEAKFINNESKIATVSMQNKLQIWDNQLNFLETFECQEKCILYSAHICYNDYDKLVLLSGTVFNEVLIWKVKRNEFTNVPVLKRLKKHDVSEYFWYLVIDSYFACVILQ